MFNGYKIYKLLLIIPIIFIIFRRKWAGTGKQIENIKFY